MWIWQHPDWPKFTFDPHLLDSQTSAFHEAADRLFKTVEEMPKARRIESEAQTMLAEVMATNAIEGVNLDRDSVRSSLMRQLGAAAVSAKPLDERTEVSAALLVDVRRRWADPLSDEMLGQWQTTTNGDRRLPLHALGAYRRSTKQMQIVSGGYVGDRRPKVHYEAPPSASVPAEMRRFLTWYNGKSRSLGAIARSGVAHVWFEMIHPFEDGNGRVGRAIADHALSQGLRCPTLACLSSAIEREKKPYYDGLERIGRGEFNLDEFLDLFARSAVKAQEIAIEEVQFVLNKTRFFDTYGEALNSRQARVVARVFAEGTAGFEGDLSLKNYTRIAKCAEGDAEDDLAELVGMGALAAVGEGGARRFVIAAMAGGEISPPDMQPSLSR